MGQIWHLKSALVSILLATLWACTTPSEQVAVRIQQETLSFQNVIVAYNDDTQWALAWVYRDRVRIYNDEGTRDVQWSWSDRTPERIAKACESSRPVFGARYLKK